ncbi:MAG: hypothetical protein Q9170_003467 [Blastenia crenularia]
MGTKCQHFTTSAPVVFPGRHQVPPPPSVPVSAKRSADKNPQAKEEHILLNITVEADKLLVEEFGKWLTHPSRPSHVKHVKLVGYLPVSKTKDYILQITMPVSLWDEVRRRQAAMTTVRNSSYRLVK